jgi:transcriptional regulator with GAF, ATPase, and Fis domain
VAAAADPSDLREPGTALAAVIALRRMADRMEREAVDRAIASGWTWQQVAQALGVTRQAVHQRHAARVRTGASRTEEAG